MEKVTAITSRPWVLLLGFLVAYAAAAAAFQWISKIPPWVDGAPVDIMNGAMIWMTAMIALIMAYLTSSRPVASLVWLLGSAALGVVALDEFFGMHEHASKIRDDDDPKILMALGAGIALAILIRVQKIRGAPLVLLAVGFLVHCLYLMSDLGDGDFFDVTFGNPDGLRVVEEILEFTAMGFYLSAFALVLIGVAAGQAAPAVRMTDAQWQERLSRAAGK
jgi:hypothetical protein